MTRLVRFADDDREADALIEWDNWKFAASHLGAL
jgi:hypothetical protein